MAIRFSPKRPEWMSTSPIHTAPGRGAPTRIPTACYASTCPRVPTSLQPPRRTWSALPCRSICVREKLLDGQHHLRCTLRSSCNYKLKKTLFINPVLHLEIETAHYQVARHRRCRIGALTLIHKLGNP